MTEENWLIIEKDNKAFTWGNVKSYDYQKLDIIFKTDKPYLDKDKKKIKKHCKIHKFDITSVLVIKKLSDRGYAIVVSCKDSDTAMLLRLSIP